MKKRIIYIVAATLTFFVSCDDFLERDPISDLTGKNYWKTPQDAEVGVLSIYSAFTEAMASGVWNWGEFRADNHTPNEKGTNLEQIELITNSLNYTNTSTRWTHLYTTISRANDAIQNIPKITMSPNIKNNLLAEAHAMRAWAYFYCIRVWGDVPMYTEPVKEIGDGLYRNRVSKDRIMNEIILPDLEYAYYLISKATPANNSAIVRVNVGLICALQMDVHAWNHNYEQVITIKEERINPITDNGATSTNFWCLQQFTADKFKEEWRNIFIEDPTQNRPREIFFRLAYKRQDTKGRHNGVTFFASTDPRTTLSTNLLQAYKEPGEDKRYGDTQWSSWTSAGEIRNRLRRKFWPNTAFDNNKTPDSDNDLVLYRYADVTLLYAEALNEMDRTSDAIAELNRTRTRAGVRAYMMADFIDKEEILDAILNERQREFVGEGKRWFDLVRTNRWKLVMEPINGMTDPRHVLFPIHRDHLNQNGNLEQNPGY